MLKNIISALACITPHSITSNYILVWSFLSSWENKRLSLFFWCSLIFLLAMIVETIGGDRVRVEPSTHIAKFKKNAMVWNTYIEGGVA